MNMFMDNARLLFGLVSGFGSSITSWAGQNLHNICTWTKRNNFSRSLWHHDMILYIFISKSISMISHLWI